MYASWRLSVSWSQILCIFYHSHLSLLSETWEILEINGSFSHSHNSSFCWYPSHRSLLTVLIHFFLTVLFSAVWCWQSLKQEWQNISNSSKEMKSEDNTSLHSSLCLDLKWMHMQYIQVSPNTFFIIPVQCIAEGILTPLWFGVSVCVSTCVSCLDLVNAIETKDVCWCVSNFADILDERMPLLIIKVKDQGHNRQKCIYLCEHTIYINRLMYFDQTLYRCCMALHAYDVRINPIWFWRWKVKVTMRQKRK